MAINKQAIIDMIFRGEAEHSRISAWHMGGAVNKPEWQPLYYNPAKAKALLAEAGYANGFKKPIIMNVLNYPMEARTREVSLAVANDWEAIGLEVKRNTTEYAVVRPKLAGRNFAWQAIIPSWPVALEKWLMFLFTHYSKATYLDGFENPELDLLIEKASTQPDFDKRMEATLELGQYAIDHELLQGICITNKILAMSPKTKSWRLNKIGGGSPRDYEYITAAE